jgi:hypothetical protein
VVQNVERMRRALSMVKPKSTKARPVRASAVVSRRERSVMPVAGRVAAVLAAGVVDGVVATGAFVDAKVALVFARFAFAVTS